MPRYKRTTDVIKCRSYGHDKLLEHAVKIVERILERMPEVLDLNNVQFMPGKETYRIIDALFALQRYQEEYRKTNNKLYIHVFSVNFEKA